MLPKSGDHHTVPLSVLLKRESANEKIERPEISHGQASQSKKGEDFTFIKTECQRYWVMGSPHIPSLRRYFPNSSLQLFDGHNGSAAAIYSKENLLNNVLSAIPSDLSSDEWVLALPRALVAGFVKTDKEFQERAQTSGTTATFVIIEGWVLTAASVGDSRGIFESAEGAIYYLSADHRLECCEEERERITASGGEVGRLNTGGGTEEAVQVKGLRDDTTCIVVDIQPHEKPEPPKPPSKKQGKRVFKSMFRKKPSESSSQVDKEEYSEPDVVEELFEEGSASLSERLDSKYPVCNMFKLFMCAVCQVEIKPGEGISIHAGTADPRKSRPWDGPFLCSSCQEKKEAMEGRRPSGASRYSSGSE
ncbi:UNVERIFIED_CONTAM: putative protein phosphatase 2C 12 [Sesamum radiatum]|uniref:PPM-type phosphatase domain-containing protein n=1 Tax=Sesamum radiatum TaxID=300843 RepID=A0AAW2QEQ3_SESRA